MFRFIKRVSIATFTIHELRIPEQTSDEFYVSWKRGTNSGMTECAITNHDNSIVFEKKFTCKVTIFISKKDGQIRPKMIKFKVFRINPTKGKKIFGELDMDISKGYQKAPITQTYLLKGFHHKSSHMILSYDVSPINKDKDIDEDDEDFTNTATNENVLQSDDKLEHWDVSEHIQPEEEALLLSYFGQNEKRESYLSQFGAVPSARSLMRSQRAQQIGQIDKNQTTGSRKNSNELPFFNPFGIPNKDEKESMTFLPVKKDKQIDPKILIKSVITKEWCKSPLPKGIPIPSVAIYAAFLSTEILSNNSTYDDASFTDLTKDLFAKYKTSNIVYGATPCDRFIVSLYLLALLKDVPNKNPERLDIIVNNLNDHCCELLQKITYPLLDNFSATIRTLVLSQVEQSSPINELTLLLEESKKTFGADEPFDKFFLEFLISSIDLMIVQFISSTPQICNFTNAIQWNSTNTILTEKDINFPLFREAASVLMMSAIICTDPHASDEICPNLKKDYVLKILTNQQPDDFCPMPNDVMTFMNEYNIKTTTNVGNEKHVYKGDFSEIISLININEWKSVKFEEITLTSFPYLKKYFS